MVAGDLVNTAVADPVRSPSPGRCSSARRPGARPRPRSPTRTAGEHELKGKVGACCRSTARSACLAARGGAQKSAGLEPPFVGRDRELRLVKELFHGCAEEGKAHLVSVTGIAGIGKSRLAWEFEKYVDGLADDFWWHRGRCLAYGEGVAYWALAEMVRMRAGILEEEAPELGARQAPRVDRGAHRRRRGAQPGSSRGSPICSAWPSGPLPTARTSSRPGGSSSSASPSSGPVVLRLRGPAVGGRRRSSTSSSTCSSGRAATPLFVLALARPELPERRPDLRGRRSQRDDALARAALRAGRWSELLDGFVPGLPEELRGADPRAARRAFPSTRSRRCACCSTAACSRATATSTGRRARSRRSTCPRRCTRSSPRGSTASRAEERRLLQDAAVLGKSFTKAGLAALSDSARAGARAAAHLARPQGGALGPGRSSLAGAWPVQLPPGPAQARRLRDAGQGRAQGPPPRGGGVSRAGVRGGRAGDRRGDRGALPRRLPGGARRRRRGRDQGEGAGDARRGRASARPRWRRTRRPSTTSSGRPSSPTTRSPRPALRERAGATAWVAGRQDAGTRAFRARARASTRRRD